MKRGTVQLYEHEQAWKTDAQNTILRLKEISGSVIKDIRHVDSAMSQYKQVGNAVPVNLAYEVAEKNIQHGGRMVMV